MKSGILKHNQQGRYEFEDGYYFTSGELIQIFYDGIWISGRIEYSHDKQDYYFVNEEEGIYIYDLSGIRGKSI